MTDDTPLVYLIAGEPSGDQLGAFLMRALKEQTDGRVRFAGIGGEHMRAQGLESLVPIAELAVMGFLEVLPAVLRLRRRLREVIQDINAKAPAVVVTIDSWGFTGRVHKALADAGNPARRIHYVAPMVWVWKAGRVKAVAARVHKLLCLWPFEPALFAAEGLDAVHVGHAVIEAGLENGNAAAFRSRHGIDDDAPVLLVLPGSRRGEVSRLLPVLRPVVEGVVAAIPSVRIVVPTLQHLRGSLQDAVKTWPGRPVVVGSDEKADAFAVGTAAVAASGTISLELALCSIPHAVCYKVNPLSAALFRRLLPKGWRFANMVNILLDRLVVPELLQENCVPSNIQRVVLDLLQNKACRDTQKAGLALAVGILKGTDTPSRSAARHVLSWDEADRL